MFKTMFLFNIGITKQVLQSCLKSYTKTYLYLWAWKIQRQPEVLYKIRYSFSMHGFCTPCWGVTLNYVSNVEVLYRTPMQWCVPNAEVMFMWNTSAQSRPFLEARQFTRPRTAQNRKGGFHTQVIQFISFYIHTPQHTPGPTAMVMHWLPLIVLCICKKGAYFAFSLWYYSALRNLRPTCPLLLIELPCPSVRIDVFTPYTVQAHPS